MSWAARGDAAVLRFRWATRTFDGAPLLGLALPHHAETLAGSYESSKAEDRFAAALGGTFTVEVCERTLGGSPSKLRVSFPAGGATKGAKASAAAKRHEDVVDALGRDETVAAVRSVLEAEEDGAREARGARQLVEQRRDDGEQQDGRGHVGDAHREQQPHLHHHLLHQRQPRNQTTTGMLWLIR